MRSWQPVEKPIRTIGVDGERVMSERIYETAVAISSTYMNKMRKLYSPLALAWVGASHHGPNQINPSFFGCWRAGLASVATVDRAGLVGTELPSHRDSVANGSCRIGHPRIEGHLEERTVRLER